MPWVPFDNIWDGSDFSKITGSLLHPMINTDVTRADGGGVTGGLAVVCFDTLRNRVLLFGATQNDDIPPSFQAAADFQGFWEYDVASGQWSELTPANRPPTLPTRGWRCMAYDEARDRVVLIQTSSTSSQSETWEYDAADWTLIVDDNAPTAPSSSTTFSTHLDWAAIDMCYDAINNEIVFLQLNDGFPFPGRRTWTYNGTWTLKTPDSSGRDNAEAGTIAFDRNRGLVVAFQVDFAHTGVSEDWNNTEEWDGATWTAITTRTLSGGEYHITSPANNPKSTARPSMVYDPVTEQILLLNAGGPENPSLSPKEGFTNLCGLWDGSDWVGVTPATTPAFWDNTFNTAAWPATFDPLYFYEPMMVELSDSVFLVGGLDLVDDVKAISHTFGLA